MKKMSALLVIIAGISWGSSCLFVDKLTELGFTSLQCTAIRILFAALILNFMLIIKGRGFKYYKLSPRSYLTAAVSGVCSVFAMSAFYYACMTRTSAAVSVILLYTAPIFVMLMSLIIFREKLSAKKIAAFAVAIVGCALVSGVASGVTVNVGGIIFGLLSGFCYSLYGILTAVFMKRNSEPLAFSAVSFIFASVAAVAVCDPVDAIQNTVSVGKIYWLLPLFVLFSICTAVLPYVFYTQGVAGLSPSVASILAFSEPLTGAIFGVVVLGQPTDIFGVVGMLLVVCAIVILNIKTPKKHKNDKMSTESY